MTLGGAVHVVYAEELTRIVTATSIGGVRIEPLDCIGCTIHEGQGVLQHENPVAACCVPVGLRSCWAVYCVVACAIQLAAL
eukprot:5226230-Amphidinium_carterae.1